MIAGVTLGVIAFVALVAVGVALWYRKRHYQNKLQPLGSEYSVGRASGYSASARAEGTDAENGSEFGGVAQPDRGYTAPLR